MYIEWPEGIVDMGIINEEFLIKYCILIGKLMYGSFDAALIWLIPLAKHLVNKCNLNSSKADSCILFRKYEKWEVGIRNFSPCGRRIYGI